MMVQQPLIIKITITTMIAITTTKITPPQKNTISMMVQQPLIIKITITTKTNTAPQKTNKQTNVQGALVGPTCKFKSPADDVTNRRRLCVIRDECRGFPFSPPFATEISFLCTNYGGFSMAWFVYQRGREGGGGGGVVLVI